MEIEADQVIKDLDTSLHEEKSDNLEKKAETKLNN
jgi:hypothetical protein